MDGASRILVQNLLKKFNIEVRQPSNYYKVDQDRFTANLAVNLLSQARQRKLGNVILLNVSSGRFAWAKIPIEWGLSNFLD